MTLAHSMAEEIAAKVASGECASESEVICDGVRALQARDKAIELGSAAKSATSTIE